MYQKRREGQAMKENNFSSIKFFAAIMVIFAHSFPISYGANILDPLSIYTNKNLTFGLVGVLIFLVFSGYFITKSLVRNSNFKYFFKNRIKRILPPLIIVILSTVFIVGPIFTKLSLEKYFCNIDTWKYLIKNSFLITTHNLPGVFINNPYYFSVNGSLWTLPVEFLCYIMIFIFIKLKGLNEKYFKYTLILPLTILLFKNNLYNFIPLLKDVLPLFICFYLGVYYRLYGDKIINNKKIFIISVVLFICSLIFKWYSVFSFICLPFIALYLGNSKTNILKPFRKVGTYSYEIYLISFPIQQIVTYLLRDNITFYYNFIISLVIIIPLAILLHNINKFITN